MSAHHKIENIKIENGKLTLVVDGKSIERALADISAKLSMASTAELERYEVSPSGYGIYWPLLDEDISMDGLLGVKHAPKTSRRRA